ncbi:hypothetical protein [Sunxiuqinia sp. sy24]|uniref:hypothetical protein n=1 Tax=Sunxiuqinia sp. sy24 TaxID=3461495 RepID=UPI004045C9A5
MKTPDIKKNKSLFIQEHRTKISFRDTDNNRQYKPFPGEKGLQCDGDKFDYVVEWEIHEELFEK